MKKAFLVSVASLLLMGVCSCSTVENVKEPTEYALKEDCFLCGDRGLLSLYQDGVAVLNLNTFEVYTLKMEEGSGNTDCINSNGENRTTVEVRTNSERKISHITLRVKDDSKPDPEEISQILCKNCSDSIMKNNTYDVSFIDLSKKELIPLREESKEFYVGDYVVYQSCKSEDNTMEYLVFYASENQS